MELEKEMDLETIQDLKSILVFARNRFKNTLFMWECENDFPYTLFHTNVKDNGYVFDIIAEHIEEHYSDKKWINSVGINCGSHDNILPDKDIVHHISYTKHINKSY